MKKLNYIVALLMLVFMAACSDDNNVESTIKDGPKPTMDIAVSPAT